MYQFSRKSSRTYGADEMSNFAKGWYSKSLSDEEAKMCKNPDFTAFRTREFSSDSYVLGSLKLNDS